ncbi:MULTISPECIES: DUF58 domain-containing protein [Rhodomicrobium]|uniref:DUF58 domain-containing protein n=1 Tax=Rhodomicrobium TaxID=1068 RepID=UPI000B4B132C|nr:MULTISPECIES: DUF58 domain-containing protein [Rhodomicrobium]
MISADAAALIEEATRAAIPYRLRWKTSAARPGAHGGRQPGAGGAFRDFAPLMQYPDPRRIDMRASLRDPLGALHVRRFEQRTAVTVMVLADVSASMAFEGHARKMRLLAVLSAALAMSARQYGDRFGFFGCDETVREELFLPASTKRGIEVEVVRRLLAFEPRGRSAMGLIDAARQLGGRRKLVFLLSDFHMPLRDVEAILEALARHDVLPVLLRDGAEEVDLPRWGLAELIDLETGRKRLAVMRPSLHARWRNEARERDAALDRLCARYARPLVRLSDRIDPQPLLEALAAG